MQSIPDCDVILSVMPAVSTGADTYWQNTWAGDDYSPAAAGTNRPLLFVIGRNESAEAISLANFQTLTPDHCLLNPEQGLGIGE